ncbi:MAG: packaged DNA stabilization protein [Candidatus Magasanikiibacteriota bacterium]
MAFSKTPVNSTYETKRINLVTNPQQRSGALQNKDARIVNMMPELFHSQSAEEKRFVLKSRPGLSSAYTVNTGVARGIYYWLYSGTGYVITVVGNAIYVNGTSLSTVTTTTGEVGFTEFLNSSGVVSLVLLDGTKGYVFANPSTAPTEITDAQFPTPHVPHPIFLDGYLFVAKASTADVYNSNLDDPSLWTAGDFATAEMYPDKLVALSKNNNYLYAIGSNSVEYLYDAANATGSPLSRHDSAVQQFGTPAPGTVVATENEVILVGQTGNGGYTVWTIEGFKEKEISTPAIRGVLHAEGAALATSVAYCVRVASQKLYILTLTSRTLVYSFETQIWTEWASGATSATAFLGARAADGPNGMPYVLKTGGTTVYKVDEATFTDGGTVFRCEVVTAKEDFDSINRKTMSRLAIVGDVPDSTGVDNDVSIEWSDDDYATWSTARTLSFNFDFPVLRQLGTFRRRAFRIRYSLPHLFRIDGLEVDINKGSQ